MSNTPWNDDSDYLLAENPRTEASGPSRFGSRTALVIMLVILLVAGLGLVVVGFLVSGRSGGSGSVSAAPQFAKVGLPAPDFALKDVATGQVIRLSELKGRPVWINFWATWCAACRVEMPQMKTAYARYRDKGLAILGIDVQESPEDVLKYAKAGGYDWTFLIDADGSLLNRYVVNGIPTHWFVGRDGVLKATFLGAMPQDALEANVAQIVGP